MTNHRTVSWELDKDFVGKMNPERGAFCVRVNVQRLQYPKYSYILGWLPPSAAPDGFRVFFQQDQDISNDLDVIFEAIDYIKKKLAEVNASRAEKIQQQQLREDEAASERIQKKKQYEANVQARRDNNRARTEIGKKGNKSAIT